MHLTLAVCDYEHVREIAQGLVRADGITLTPLIFPSIEEITFRSKTPISCALEDGAGQVVHRKARVTDCSMLVRPGAEKFKVRVTDENGQIVCEAQPDEET